MFHPDNFGDLTIDVVLQALDQGQRLRRQDAHLNELSIATLTSCFVNANRDPKKGKPAKPSDFFYFAQSDSLDPAIANAFFSLITDRLMPSWVVHAAPIDVLKQAKTDGNHPKKNRMLIGKGIAIFCPDIGQKMYSDFAIFNEAAWGWQKLTDIDSGKEYEVFVIPPEYEQQYCRDLTLERR
jgi:hypothetical protein